MHQEILYRKCCKREADTMLAEQRLGNGHIPYTFSNTSARSDPDKWVSINPRFTNTYFPRGHDEGHYSHIAVMTLKSGTIEALRLERAEGNVHRGPKGSFGITPELLPWFNGRVRKVEIYNPCDPSIPRPTEISHTKLLRAENKYATFASFSPKYLSASNFSGEIKRHRMSWVKSSLLWTLWRSDWGHAPGQERVVEIDVPVDYMEHLFAEAVPSGGAKGQEIIMQKDPDRRIIGRRFVTGNAHFVNGGKTVHFGLRGRALDEFIDSIVPGNLTDITEIVQHVERERKPHPTQTLYDLLNLRREPHT